MLVRLGHVLGWVANILAALLLLFAFSVWRPGSDDYLWILGFAIVVFLIGRALRYIFAGPESKNPTDRTTTSTRSSGYKETNNENRAQITAELPTIDHPVPTNPIIRLIVFLVDKYMLIYIWPIVFAAGTVAAINYWRQLWHPWINPQVEELLYRQSGIGHFIAWIVI
jgi:hypothetical protein